MSENVGSYSNSQSWGVLFGAALAALLLGGYNAIKSVFSKDKVSVTTQLPLELPIRRSADFVGDRIPQDQSEYFVFFSPPNGLSTYKFRSYPNLSTPPKSYSGFNNYSNNRQPNTTNEYNSFLLSDSTSLKTIKSLLNTKFILLKEGDNGV